MATMAGTTGVRCLISCCGPLAPQSALPCLGVAWGRGPCVSFIQCGIPASANLPLREGALAGNHACGLIPPGGSVASAPWGQPGLVPISA